MLNANTLIQVVQLRIGLGGIWLTRLKNLGLITPRLVTVHFTHLTEPDIELLSEKGPNVVHCPNSNMKLASGICNVSKLIHHGVNVALGTDGAASNNRLDMFGEMRAAALLAKVSTEDATSLPMMVGHPGITR